MRTFNHTLPSDLAEVPTVRELFEAACVSSGVVDEELDAWKLIFTELVCNAIEHGCNGPEEMIEVRYAISDDEVELRVFDPGECDPALRSLFDRTTSNFAETGRGAGLILVRAFTDEVDVSPVPTGTEIRVMKRRGGVS